MRQVEVSKPKNADRYLEFLIIELKAVVWFFVKCEYFFGDTLHM